MNKRHQELLELLIKRERLGVDELATRFGVSDMTVRRDLQHLEERGHLTRTHGGCVLRSPRVHEMAFSEKERLHRDAKQAIARRLVCDLPDEANIYVDTGTTCALVAGLLPPLRRSLRVFTNNLPVAMALFDIDGYDVVVPGGELGRRSPDLTGDEGLERLADLCFDVAVVGADALDASRGEFYSADRPTARLSMLAQQRADAVFACIDSSKFGQRALAVAGRLNEKVTLYAECAPPEAEAAAIRAAGADIAIADETVQAAPGSGRIPRTEIRTELKTENTKQ